MNLDTVPVSGQLNLPSGAPASGAHIRFTLSALGVDGLALVLPRFAEGVCDASGAFVLDVVPSPAGTSYVVKAWQPAGLAFFTVQAVVPGSACQLTQIMHALPYPALDASQQALIVVQAAVAAAGAKAQLANLSAEASQTALESAEALTVTVSAAYVTSINNTQELRTLFLNYIASHP